MRANPFAKQVSKWARAKAFGAKAWKGTKSAAKKGWSGAKHYGGKGWAGAKHYGGKGAAHVSKHRKKYLIGAGVGAVGGAGYYAGRRKRRRN